jgi:hypothetical protein
VSITVLVSVKVADFNQWKTVFDGHASAREAAGIQGTPYRNPDDDSNAVVIGTAPSKEAFISFFSAPEMQEIQKEAGAMGPPEVKFLEGA